ncbi:MAG: type III pantothenate kinase [Bacteriovorax sp.]|jgi:type III pantothenate kinase|nr:type III pantothenate kinase [Bacteriovorax sp.]
MRLITIDNGNSNPHVGLFEDKELIKVIPLKDYIEQKDDFIIMSDVGPPLQIKPSYSLKKHRHTNELPSFFEMPVHYSETLGDDRLIWGYALFQKIQNDNDRILAIDAGTFMTMDLITSQGFMGGFIFPGLKTFLTSYAKGSLLPDLSENKIQPFQLPQTTNQAILSATDHFLESTLASMICKLKPSQIFVTGGSMEIVYNKLLELNLGVQLERDPHSIHLALALIFQSQLQREAF